MSRSFELQAGPFGDAIEGLAWDGEALLFSRPAVNAILRFDPRKRQVGEFRRFTNHTSGLAVAPTGEVYGCQRLSRRIVRFNRDGSTSPMAYRLPDGAYHNMPKHLSIDRQGRIWFSDPLHSQPASGPPAPFPGHQSVLRLSQRGDRAWVLQRCTYDTLSPAGVLVSADDSTLYVAETSDSHAELRAYPILADGTLGRYSVLHAFGADSRGIHRGVDGMCLDPDGNIVACAGSSTAGPGPLIYIFSPTPSGRLLRTETLPVDDAPTVCAFGGPDGQRLYVATSAGHLFAGSH